MSGDEPLGPANHEVLSRCPHGCGATYVRMDEHFCGSSREGEQVTYFTKDDGEIVGIACVRRRAVRAVAKIGKVVPELASKRSVVLARTVGDDKWLAERSGQTVASLVKDVESVLLGEL